MAVTTRGITALKAPAAKASSRPTVSSRTKTSSKSKSVSRTKTASKPAQKTAPIASDVLNVPETPSPGMASLDLIEEIDVEVLNSAASIWKLIQTEMAKALNVQPTASLANTYRVRKSRSRRRYRRSRRYSTSSGVSTDLEEGDRLMVSFLHHEEGVAIAVPRSPNRDVSYL